MTAIERRSAFITNKTIVPINLILFNQQLMKKVFVSFFIFIATGLGSALLGAPGDATFVIGIICAVLYLIFSRKKKSKGNSSSGTSYAGPTRSSTLGVKGSKKYSSKAVAQLLDDGDLYVCRFADGSNMTRIDLVTRARIVFRGGDPYVAFPDYFSGEYRLDHGYSQMLGGYCMYVNEGGDNFDLMDREKYIILY